MTNWDVDLVRTAWSVAAKAHGGQQYNGSRPGERLEYLQHIGGVTLEITHALLYHPEADGTLAITCAILHDTIEDTNMSEAALAARFGPKITAGVAALSKDPDLPGKEERMRDSLRRIREQPPEVWMVKMADRIVNLSPPPFHWDRPKIEAYRREARLIHDELEAASEFLSGRLQEKINAYAKYLSDR